MTDPKHEPVAWPLGSYAPGDYMCCCMTCGDKFEGDKRALCCLSCSVIGMKASFKALTAQLDALKEENERMKAQAPSCQSARPAALAHISVTDDEVIVDLEVLDGTFLQPEMTPVPLYTNPQPVGLYTCDDLVNAGKRLKGIVDGIDGTMKHGTWRDDRGNRLKDTPEWVRFYNAVSREGYVLVPVEPTAAMMEAVSGEMAEQRSTHIHIFSADVWAAMLSAALTQPPLPESGESVEGGEDAQADLVDADWFDQIAFFLVKHDMLDASDEYDISNVMAALTDNYEPKAAPRKKASYVGAPAIFELQLACNPIIKAFGHTIYHVGSSLERPDWRDVDLVMIMDDDDFTAEFPDASQHGAGWEMDPKWLLLTSSISNWLSEKSGVPVDFKFQPVTFANEHHNGRRNPIGRFLTVSARKDEAHEKC